MVISNKSLRHIEARAPPAKFWVYETLVERHEIMLYNLPNGLAIGRSLVTVNSRGTVSNQAANFGFRIDALSEIHEVFALKSCTSSL